MPNEYPMTISRLTVDKLGVKLYDKVSAVIAELVSNSYDADATEVIVEAPMGEYLASRSQGIVTDRGRQIQITDNGIGMTPGEVIEYYLKVGAERRNDNRRGRGDISPLYGRKVMGRKGVGKLAPFGVCETIEVITSGGDKVTRRKSNGESESGYVTAHFILNRNAILRDTDEVYFATPGEHDDELRPMTGTTVILKRFSYRYVPDHTTFNRQLSQRFGIGSADWHILTRNNLKRAADEDYEREVGVFSIDTMENSKITLEGLGGVTFRTADGSAFHAVDSTGTVVDEFTAGFHYDGSFYPITGWAAYAKEPYRDDLMVGIRIYCRGKIAAQTALFGQKAGFHGEHDIRSYLVGELRADWLDEDDDLIQTDRRDVLWSHELGQEFERWGQVLVKKIGQVARTPMRIKTWQQFFETGRVQERILQEFPNDNQAAIRGNAEDIARLLGQSMKPGEAEDVETVEPLVDLALSIAPHVTLDKTLREAADVANTPMTIMSTILRTARVAELSSFGRIAEDRLKIIERVKNLKDDPDTAEAKLQDLVTYAPWLINPQWAPITANQAFTTLKREFEKYYKEQTGHEISLGDFSETRRRPDFVLSSQDSGLQIIEIKKPAHGLQNDEMDRVITYHQVMEAFLTDPANSEFSNIFTSFHITLVCDDLSLTGAQQVSFDKFLADGVLTHINWATFLLRTELMHRDFLEEAARQRRNIEGLGG